MPTTHDGHQRSHPVGLDLFGLVLVAIVVFTVMSMLGLPGYAPAIITAAAVLIAWGVLSYQGTHPHRR